MQGSSKRWDFRQGAAIARDYVRRPRLPDTLGAVGTAGPRAGPVYYLAFETNAVEPPLIRLCVREPETGYGLISHEFSQAMTCFHALTREMSRFRGLKARFFRIGPLWPDLWRDYSPQRALCLSSLQG